MTDPKETPSTEPPATPEVPDITFQLEIMNQAPEKDYGNKSEGEED